MSLMIKSLENFASEIKKLSKRYKKISDDLKCLKKELEVNPKSGISLGGSCYKIRVPNSSVLTGKSGGFRVIYYFLSSDNVIYLMSIYSKSDMKSIDELKLQQILKENGLA
ncbi:MAG: hypothetical protein KN64_08590 [Sulfurovum sp. AS07-7]|nr:MAG: hypothetical protein KN64_08590 [Sulfurovum sp. AS07-7]